MRLVSVEDITHVYFVHVCIHYSCAEPFWTAAVQHKLEEAIMARKRNKGKRKASRAAKQAAAAAGWLKDAGGRRQPAAAEDVNHLSFTYKEGTTASFQTLLKMVRG